MQYEHVNICFEAIFELTATGTMMLGATYAGDSDHPAAIPFPVRGMMGAFGIITFLISRFLFMMPELMIGLCPWKLTPLTARVMGAMFSLPGAVGLCLAFERRWSAAKLILFVQSFAILVILIAAAPGSWLRVGGLGGRWQAS